MSAVLVLMKSIWRGWKNFAHGLIAGQTWLLMAISYFGALAPVAIGFRLFKPDPLDRGLGDTASPTYWQTPKMGPQDIRRAQRPW